MKTTRKKITPKHHKYPTISHKLKYEPLPFHRKITPAKTFIAMLILCAGCIGISTFLAIRTQKPTTADSINDITVSVTIINNIEYSLSATISSSDPTATTDQDGIFTTTTPDLTLATNQTNIDHYKVCVSTISSTPPAIAESQCNPPITECLTDTTLTTCDSIIFTPEPAEDSPAPDPDATYTLTETQPTCFDVDVPVGSTSDTTTLDLSDYGPLGSFDYYRIVLSAYDPDGNALPDLTQTFPVHLTPTLTASLDADADPDGKYYLYDDKATLNLKYSPYIDGYSVCIRPTDSTAAPICNTYTNPDPSSTSPISDSQLISFPNITDPDDPLYNPAGTWDIIITPSSNDGKIFDSVRRTLQTACVRCKVPATGYIKIGEISISTTSLIIATITSLIVITLICTIIKHPHRSKPTPKKKAKK
jgi:hypothetical protein